MPTRNSDAALSPTDHDRRQSRPWLKQEGDAIAAGDVIAEIETDKATMEVEAVDEGTLGRIRSRKAAEGVAVNTASPSSRRRRGQVGARELRLGERRGEGGASGGFPPAQGRARGQKTGRAKSALPTHAIQARSPEVPEGTEMVRQTVREGAARCHGRGDAQEQGRLPMGEEVAEYQGAYKISQGLLEESGPKRVIRHAHHRARLRRARRGCRHGGPPAHHRVHDLELRHAGDRPHHQLGRQDPLHGGRRDGQPHRLSRPQRGGRPGRGPAQPGIQLLVRALSRPQGDCPLRRRRRQGAAQGRHP